MADAEEIRKSHELTTDKESSKTHRRAVISSDADEEDSSSTSTRLDTFLNVVALGNMGAGKSAVLNSILEHQILLTGDYGVTLTPVVIDVSTKANQLPVDQKTSHVSADTVKNYLSDKVWKHTSGNNHPEVRIKLHTSNSPPLKLIELPGLDQPFVDASMISKYAQQNDAILLVVVPASQASQISSSQALKIAKEYDPESTRTVGVIGIMDQAAVLEEHPPGENWKELPPDRRFVLNSEAVAAVEALLSSQGPPETAKIQWIALSPTCLSVSIASAQSGSGENSLETVWRSETESLKSLFAGALESKLGRIALVNTLASKIHSRMKLRLPNILSGLQGKSDQSVQAELEGLYGKLVNSHGGTSAIALELCREIEDKLHFADSEVAPEIIEFELADEEDPHDDFDAVSKNWDIVKNLKTGVFGVVYGSDISYISQSHAPGLRKDEVTIVDRNFRIGETVTRLGDITEEVGIVVAVQKNVILTSIDGNTTTTKVSAADGLERIREYFKDDIVYKGTRIGRVQKTELVTMFVYEDQSELTVLDPLYELVLTNGLEAMVGEPFYKGQQIVHQDEKGVVKGHWVNRILVKWFDDERTEPPVWVKNKEVRVLLPIPTSSVISPSRVTVSPIRKFLSTIVTSSFRSPGAWD